MTLQAGERFTVSATTEMHDARGRLLARYLPGFEYRVTPRNVGEVAKLVDDGVITPGARPAPGEANILDSRPAKLKGRVRTSKEKTA